MLAPFPLAHVSVCHTDGLLEARAAAYSPGCPLSDLMLCLYEEFNECLFLRREVIALDDMVFFLK